jgi:phage baseplate assembly protein gpV
MERLFHILKIRFDTSLYLATFAYMLRFGIISELGEGENAGFVRVSFDESEIVSDWLSLPSANTRTAKQWIPVEVNSQVACLMDEWCKQGCIVAVLWSATDTPPEWASKDTTGIKFADNTEIYYDAAEHTLTVNAPDAELNFTCKKLNITGDVNVTGEITASEEVTAGTMKIKLTQHKHPTPAGVSGIPTP